jgi:hypothetical protein
MDIGPEFTGSVLDEGKQALSGDTLGRGLEMLHVITTTSNLSGLGWSSKGESWCRSALKMKREKGSGEVSR